MVAGWPRWTQATARQMAATEAGDVEILQQDSQAEEEQVEDQRHAGIWDENTREEDKVVAIELGRTVKDFAERERAEAGFHAGLP